MRIIKKSPEFIEECKTKFLEYFGGDADVTIPTSCGFNVSNGNDPYDKRVALRINYTVAENGYEGYQIMTFYNFGNAKYGQFQEQTF